MYRPPLYSVVYSDAYTGHKNKGKSIIKCTILFLYASVSYLMYLKCGVVMRAPKTLISWPCVIHKCLPSTYSLNVTSIHTLQA